MEIMKSKLKLIPCLLLLSIIVLACSSQNKQPDLQSSIIWTSLTKDSPEAATCVGFRKEITYKAKPGETTMKIFADSRYMLWINGKYVLRGPCRFDPKGPQYDELNIQPFLKEGTNLIAILVQANISGSLKLMKHSPGLLVQISGVDREGNKIEEITDQSWLCSNKTEFLAPPKRRTWACIMDSVDAKMPDAGWINSSFDDSKWSGAVSVDGAAWGKFEPRALPLLDEIDLGSGTIIQVTHKENVDTRKRILPQSLPLTFEAGAEIIIDLGKLSLAYWDIEIEASDKSMLVFTPCQNFVDGKTKTSFNCQNYYKAKKGKQKYICSDTFGFRYLNLKVEGAPVTINAIKFTARLYPNIELSKFECDDAFLTKTWDVAKYSARIIIEDGYSEAAERAEWMGDVGMLQYAVSRKIICGPGKNKGEVVYSDPRPMKNMLRHVIQSQQEDGRLKAHHPSDRWDEHWYIEDYSCLWVQGLRQYYDNTGDIEFLKEAWSALQGQMDWFLNRKNITGLITAREFLIHLDNPMRYQRCQGATLNAFVYQALVESAYLAEALGKNADCTKYEKEAESLKIAYNKYLWDDTNKTFFAAVYYKDMKEGKMPELKLVSSEKPAERTDQWLSPGEKVIPSIQAALLALNKGVVSNEHLSDVEHFLKSHYNDLMNPYTHIMLFDELYKFDSPEMDLEVLNTIRRRWKMMISAESPGTVWERFDDSGYLCHPFGQIPAYTIPAYVLGVRKPKPVWEKEILLEPRLGDLTMVKGVGITELGAVPVSWEKNKQGNLIFSFKIPAGITAIVRLEKVAKFSKLILDGKSIASEEHGRFHEFKVDAGYYSGQVIAN